jgi:hypothetical protein
MNHQRLQLFEGFLKSANNHLTCGQDALASGDLSYAILSLVSAVTTGEACRNAAVTFLQSCQLNKTLTQYGNMLERLPQEELGIFVTVAVAHTASLLAKHDLAEYLVGRVQYPGRHFWNEYARAMQCLVSQQAYDPKLGTLKGSQKYWAAYLPFISDVTHGRDPSGSLEAMRLSFQKRQADKRITDDGGIIVEGSAKQPTHWDFRAEALKAYVSYKYGLTFSE